MTDVGNAVAKRGFARSAADAGGDRAVRRLTVPLHVERADGTIRTIRPTVVYLANGQYEFRAEDRVIGFIHRAGHTFVASVGDRRDRAVECGQSLVWDVAATSLVAAAGLLPDS